MHMSTLCLEHDKPPISEAPSYSRHFNSKKGLRPVTRSSQYPSQFIRSVINVILELFLSYCSIQ